MNQEQHAAAATDRLDEEYYQITTPILDSFPKFRPPLDLYYLNEDVAQLLPYIKQGTRMSDEQRDELAKRCAKGLIFVSRSDHNIYAKHISKQLDLVLMDSKLLPGECAEIFRYAMTKRVGEFFEQPVKTVLAELRNDVLVVTEYLAKDPERAKALFRQLHKDFTLENHQVNVGFLGLCIYFKFFEGEEIKRRSLDRIALGLFTLDVGLSKVPKFILEKKGYLAREEQDKIQQHPLISAQILRNLDILEDETLHCVVEHKERMDGKGWPRRLKGKDISFAGRLAAVADYYNLRMMRGVPVNLEPDNYRPDEEDELKLAMEMNADKNSFEFKITLPLVTLIEGMRREEKQQEES